MGIHHSQLTMLVNSTLKYTQKIFVLSVLENIQSYEVVYIDWNCTFQDIQSSKKKIKIVKISRLKCVSKLDRACLDLYIAVYTVVARVFQSIFKVLLILAIDKKKPPGK